VLALRQQQAYAVLLPQRVAQGVGERLSGVGIGCEGNDPRGDSVGARAVHVRPQQLGQQAAGRHAVRDHHESGAPRGLMGYR